MDIQFYFPKELFSQPSFCPNKGIKKPLKMPFYDKNAFSGVKTRQICTLYHRCLQLIVLGLVEINFNAYCCTNVTRIWPSLVHKLTNLTEIEVCPYDEFHVEWILC